MKTFESHKKEGERMMQFLQRGSPLPRFYVYPQFLLTMDLSETTKMIYMLLLDRARLSMQKETWQDDQGRVFIHYTIQSLAATIQRSEMTVKNALKALEQRGLIYRQRQGVGMPNRIYVKVQTDNCPMEETENCLSGGTTFYPQKDRKLSASNNKRNNNRNYTRVYEYEEGESL